MVEAVWHVANSILFTDEEKELIAAKLARYINKDGYLQVRSSETRSQLENKLIAQQKLEGKVAKSLIVPKKRKASKPTKAMIEKRIEGKKRISEKKENRRGNWE